LGQEEQKGSGPEPSDLNRPPVVVERKREIGNEAKSLKGALGASIGPFDYGKDCLEVGSI